MTQATHTPGPWFIRTNIHGSTDLFGEDGARIIANQMFINQESNTRLIAAAPDMLAALEWLRDEYCEGGMFDGTEAEQRILSAIAKAMQS